MQLSGRSMLVLAGVVLLALGVGPARADKCTGAKLRAIAKREAGLLGCQAKVASTGDSSGLAACESKVTGKFGKAFGKAGSCGGDQATCENKADSCQTSVTAAMTDSPLASKCEAGKRKAAATLVKGELGCYSKAAAKAVLLDSACISKATAKFSEAMAKAGTCPDGGSPQSVVEASCVKSIVTIDAGSMVDWICGGGGGVVMSSDDRAVLTLKGDMDIARADAEQKMLERCKGPYRLLFQQNVAVGPNIEFRVAYLCATGEPGE